MNAHTLTGDSRTGRIPSASWFETRSLKAALLTMRRKVEPS